MGGISLRKALKAADLSASSYYYQPRSGKQGRKPSKETLKADGGAVPNGTVVEMIRSLLNKEFVHYGTEKVTRWLKRQGLVINRKKVYRLMKENRLLNPKKRPKQKDKVRVAFRVPRPERVFQHLEADIKFIYVHGKGRNAKALSFIDIYSQKIVACTVDYSIKADKVL